MEDRARTPETPCDAHGTPDCPRCRIAGLQSALEIARAELGAYDRVLAENCRRGMDAETRRTWKALAARAKANRYDPQPPPGPLSLDAAEQAAVLAVDAETDEARAELWKTIVDRNMYLDRIVALESGEAERLMIAALKEAVLLLEAGGLGQDKALIARMRSALAYADAHPRSAPCTRWTPVEHGLPERETVVIAQTDQGSHPAYVHCTTGRWMYHGVDDLLPRVTHWTPMPSMRPGPPKPRP